MPNTVDARHAKRLLQDLPAVERATRRAAQGFWFPLILFGLITIGSARFAGTDAVGVYWAIAGPAGGAITALWYARRDAPVELPGAPYIVVAIGIIVAAFVAAGLAGGQWRDAAAYLAVAVGYLAFAAIERSLVVGGFAVATAVVAVGFALGGVADSAALPLVVGCLSLVIGGTTWLARG